MKTLRPLGILAALLAFPLVNPVQAAPITVDNASFESPISAGTAQYVITSTPGFDWVTNSNATPPNTNGSINTQLVTSGLATTRGVPSAFFAGSSQAIRLFGAVNQANIAYIQQATAANLLSSTTYTLTLNIGPFSGSGGINSYSGFDVTLSAGADFSYNIATNSVAGALPSSIGATSTGSNIASASFSLTNPTDYNLALNTYTTLTMTVTTNESITNAGPLTIRIAAGNRAVADVSTIFDNVALNAVAVPEPSVVGALGLAGIVLYHVRRRAHAQC